MKGYIMKGNNSQNKQIIKLQQRIKTLEGSLETVFHAIQETNNSLAIILGSAELLVDYHKPVNQDCKKKSKYHY